MSKKENRENYILNVLSTTKELSTLETVKMLNISEATARRTFSEMEKAGKVIRTYGGVRLANTSEKYSFNESQKLKQKEKMSIGFLAASLVEDYDTIYLDCGTTLLQMARFLGNRIANNEFSSLRIITNSLANIHALGYSKTCNIILTGGEYNYERRDFSGPITEKQLDLFHFSKSFLGCDGVTKTMGFSSYQLSLSSLNTKVISKSDKVNILLDSSKFNNNAFVSFANLSEVSSIITEIMPDDNLKQILNEAKIDIKVPEENYK